MADPSVADLRRSFELHLRAENKAARWKPATAANRYRSLRVFYGWLEDEGEIAASPMARCARRRGRQADIEGLHPHQLRHTFAHLWLSEGGNETDLMRLAGWQSRAMLRRYGAPPMNAPARHTGACRRRIGFSSLLWRR